MTPLTVTIPALTFAPGARHCTMYPSLPSGCAQRQHLACLGLGPDLRAGPLRQVEVVLDQRILGVVAAAHHAAAAEPAAFTLGSRAVEVGVGHRHLGLPEIHRDFRGPEFGQPAQLPGQAAQRQVAGLEARAGDRAQHLAGRLVVGRKF